MPPLSRALEAVGLDMPLWSTKRSPVEHMYKESRVFEALAERIEDLYERTEALSTRVVALEVLAKRADGHSEVLAGMAERMDTQEASIDALAVLMNREDDEE
jgi:hypothetical protein